METENKNSFLRSNFGVLILFGMIGQIAWSVENMYFNLYVFEAVSPNLSAITLMVQLSGIVATVVTLFSGTFSDKFGNRRSFISFGYIIWGVTVALFGFLSPELIESVFDTGIEKAIAITLVLVIVTDCVMTLFGSTANDAAFNAWVTDNTTEKNRGSIEGIIAIMPLIAMLIVAGGFGILVSFIGYRMLFLSLGILISAAGIYGIFKIKDSDKLVSSGTVKDIFYGFKPSSVKANKTFYVTLLIVLVYGISCQIFMPYMIIYMKTYLLFSTLEYSLVFGAAILLGAGVNLYLTRLSDRMNKARLLYFAAAVMAVGLFGMYLSKTQDKLTNILLFGVFGFVMIVGYIFISALSGSIIRDNTPTDAVGKLQGVRMVFAVLIPMLVGPFIGNAINEYRNIPIPDASSADTMTTLFIPAPEIFLAAAICLLLSFVIIPFINTKKK